MDASLSKSQVSVSRDIATQFGSGQRIKRRSLPPPSPPPSYVVASPSWYYPLRRMLYPPLFRVSRTSFLQLATNMFCSVDGQIKNCSHDTYMYIFFLFSFRLWLKKHSHHLALEDNNQTTTHAPCLTYKSILVARKN